MFRHACNDSSLCSRSSSSLWSSSKHRPGGKRQCHSCWFSLSEFWQLLRTTNQPATQTCITSSSMATQQYSTPYAGKRVSLGDPEREFPIADAAGSAACTNFSPPDPRHRWNLRRPCIKEPASLLASFPSWHMPLAGSWSGGGCAEGGLELHGQHLQPAPVPCAVHTRQQQSRP